MEGSWGSRRGHGGHGGQGVEIDGALRREVGEGALTL